jgi:hypothetical protein
MMRDIRDAERAGAVGLRCRALENMDGTSPHRAGEVWRSLGIAELVKMWGDFVNIFLNSSMHCFALGQRR